MNIDIRDEILVAGVAKEIGGYGQQFLLMESIDNVDIVFLDSSRNKMGEAKNVPSGLSVNFEKPFAMAILKSANAQSVKIAFASVHAEFNRMSGSASIIGSVNANIIRASAINNVAPVVVGVSAASVIGANPSRKRVVFTADENNTGNIYLGAAGVTVSNSAIVLASGESWVEELASPVAFYAVSDLAAQGLRISEAT